jgi:hypothetical protein
VHYTAGAGTAFSLAAARAVPGDGVLSFVARLLLDGAGALFGAYLLLAVGLSVYGRHLRRTAPERAPLAVLPQSWAWSPGSLLPDRRGGESRPWPGLSEPGPVPAPRAPLSPPEPTLPAVPADGLPADGPPPDGLPAQGMPARGMPAPGPRARRGPRPATAHRSSALPPSAWPEPRAQAGLWPASAERVPYPGRLS